MRARRSRVRLGQGKQAIERSTARLALELVDRHGLSSMSFARAGFARARRLGGGARGRVSRRGLDGPGSSLARRGAVDPTARSAHSGRDPEPREDDRLEDDPATHDEDDPEQDFHGCFHPRHGALAAVQTSAHISIANAIARVRGLQPPGPALLLNPAAVSYHTSIRADARADDP